MIQERSPSFIPFRRPLDDVLVHGIFDLSVDQYKQLLEPLIEGTKRSWKSTRRFHLIAEIPVSKLPSGGEVNVIHLDIEKPPEGRNRKGIRRAYITLDQEWYPSSILPKSTNPNNLDKILLFLKTLESFALVARLVWHVAGVYNPDEYESVIPLPHPTSNPSAPDFSVVRGLRLSNRDESQSIVVDRRRTNAQPSHGDARTTHAGYNPTGNRARSIIND